MADVKTLPSHQAMFDKQDGRPSQSTTSQANTASAAGDKGEVKEEEKPVVVAGEDKGDVGDGTQKKEGDAASPEAKTTEPAEISDEVFLAEFKKRTGREVSSLDELKEPAKLPTPDEILAAAEREKDESLEWALGTGILSREHYEKSITEKAKDKRSIALALFTSDLQAEEKDITAEECEDRFKEFYGENEDPDSWRYKKGQALLGKVADDYLSQYEDSNVEKLAEKYREFKTDTQRQKDYNKVVNKVAKEIPKEISFKTPYAGVDGKKIDLDINVPVDEKILTQVVKEFTKPGMHNAFDGTVNPEAISREIAYHVRARMLESIIETATTVAAEKASEDIMVNLKNARNPNQPLGGPQATQKSDKTPPSHKAFIDKVK